MRIEVGCDVRCDGFSRLPEVKKALGEARRVALIAHMNADGDAVGSLTGCYAALASQITAELYPILPDGCPEDLVWLPNTDHILNGKTQTAACEKALTEANVIVGMDFNSPDRTDNLAEALRASKAVKILVDHHHNPAINDFDHILSMPSISSACELMYWTLRELYGRQCFTPDAAASLYTGMRTDTGGMAFSNTQPSLYLAAAELMDCGIDPTDINRKINNTFSPERMKFYGHAMKDLLTVYPEKRVALMVIHQHDMDDYGVQSADLTGLVNEVMRLRDTECAILIREEPNRVRLSLRSKTTTDVNRLAGELFEGGGHTRAAGATSYVSLDETVSIVKQKLWLQ